MAERASILPAVTAPRRSWRINPTVFLVAPTLAFLVVFLLLPYLNMVVMSLRTPSTRQVFAPGFTADNYLNALLDPDFYYLRILGHTMALGVMTTAICLVLAYPVAYHLAGGGARARASKAFSTPASSPPCWWVWWCAATAGSSSSPTTRA
jgi:putative spermidine/putrescine transport system permease protein